MEEYSLKYDSGHGSWIQDELTCCLEKHCVKEYCDNPECCSWICYLDIDGDCCNDRPKHNTYENCFPKCCKLENNMTYDDDDDDEMWNNCITLTCSCGWNSHSCCTFYDISEVYKNAWDHVYWDHKLDDHDKFDK